MKINLTLLNGDVLRFETEKTSAIIGRSSMADIVVPVDGMSRRHCLIEVKDEAIFVTDLGSVNGVLIEGERIPKSTPVKYDVYLNLAFGAVREAQIILEKSEDPSDKTPALTLSTPVAKRLPVRKKKEKPKNESSNGINPKITILVIVLAAVAFYFFYGYQGQIGGGERAAPAKEWEQFLPAPRL